MARAAAKRKRGPKQAPGPVAAERVSRHEPTLDQQLFFGRLRRQAKWAFVFLALVFGGSFVFLGVGSGNSGLGDVFSNVFSGSSGPSLSSLEKKVAENPRDLVAVTDLATKLQSEGRTQEAIETYKSFLALQPRSVEALYQLAKLYQNEVREQALAVQAAVAELQTRVPGDLFGLDPNTSLGRAVGAYQDPITQAIATQAEQRYAEAASRLQRAVEDALDTYKKLADLQPDDPTALFQYAQYADQQARRPQVAIAAYERFLRRFPDDSFAPDVRRRLRELKKAQAAAGREQIPKKAPRTRG